MSIAHAIHDMLSPMVQAGGARAAARSGNGLLLFAIILALFLIRAYIVQFSFNRVVPSLVARFSESPEKTLTHYRELTFVESVFLTLLVGSLVGC